VQAQGRRGRVPDLTGAVKAFAQAAEDLGYDHIVIYDHVLGAVHASREPKLTGPYKEIHEPLVTYAYLAGVTKNLGLATGVIILPQRLGTPGALNGPVRFE
jgi:alkanesulfonate monooxygenase SsuD/methylene tetrahydromethanopterin reductase-like flavin-dependent oxidoreductase (luciferase family)